MTTTGSGTWTPSGDSSSVQDRDFFSGEKASTDAYVEYAFGFSAPTIVIHNTGSTKLAYQWPRLKGQAKDSGIVPASGSVTLRDANKTGILVRSETAGSPTTYAVSAVG